MVACDRFNLQLNRVQQCYTQKTPSLFTAHTVQIKWNAGWYYDRFTFLDEGQRNLSFFIHSMHCNVHHFLIYSISPLLGLLFKCQYLSKPCICDRKILCLFDGC